ncbi:MAG: PAS domain S-box protein [Chloroflexota bacterium]|nr:PAS domain S-box protein [Chloroflexota bacterium]
MVKAQIVIVEDEEFVGAEIQKLLQGFGYEVVVAPAAATAEVVILAARSRSELVITDSSIAKIELAYQTQSLLAAIVESSDDAIMSKTLEGTILSWNQAATRIYGYSAEEVIGRSVSLLESPTRPDEVSLLLERIKRGEHVSHYETVRRRKDGTDINVSLTISPIKDKAGTIIAASTIARDITERKQSQQALEESKRHIHNILESISDAFYALDADARFTYVNNEAEKLWGISHEELVGKVIWEVFPQMLDLPPYHSLNRALTEQVQVEFEIYSAYIHQWVDVKVYPANGGISVYFRDITDRKQAEKALRQSEEMYRLLARNLPDSSVLIFDRDMRYLIAEGGALNKSGFSREMLEGKTLQEALPLEAVTRLLPYYQAALAGLENTFEDYYNDRVYLTRAVPIKNEQDSITAGMLFSEDITALKKAEQILADEKEQLSVTLRSIGDGVITTNLKGEVTLLNRVAEELTGWSQVGAVGKPLVEVFQIISEKERQPQISPLEQVLSTGQIVILRDHTLLVARDGSERIIADSCAPIRDYSSKIIGAVLVFRDITEQQKIAEERQKNSKLEALGVLAGGIAHDFNNLLTGIIGFLDLAKFQLAPRNEQEIEEVTGFLEEAYKAALRAKTLTMQLLTFARGGAPIKKTAQLIQIIHDSASFVLHGSNIEPVFELESDLWSVEVDTGQMGQVIQNLVLNADQAMPEGGFIHIRGENVELTEGTLLPLVPGKYVMLTVQDRGKGIPPENLEKIFDPYFTTKSQGNGLGLAVCFSIIKKHEGYIQVESEIGKGTTFSIYLPVSKNQLEAEASIVGTRLIISSLSKSIKLLVMDDESVLRELIKRTLQKYGHRIELAKDGQEALKLYQTALEEGEPFDVVLLDLTIPGGMGGKQTMTKLLELDPQVKAIVCSGYSSDQIMSNYREYGFVDVLLKPYRLEELSKVLVRITDPPKS